VPTPAPPRRTVVPIAAVSAVFTRGLLALISAVLKVPGVATVRGLGALAVPDPGAPLTAVLATQSQHLPAFA